MKFLIIVLLTLSVRADFVELLEQEVFSHVHNELSQDTKLKSFKISHVSFGNIDSGYEYVVNTKWSEIQKNDVTRECKADFLISDLDGDSLSINEISKSCK